MGIKGSFFKLQQICPQKSLFSGKFGGRIARNSLLGGVFPGDRKSRLGYVLKISGLACIQH